MKPGTPGGTAIPYPPQEAEGSTQPYYSDYSVRPAYMHGGFTLINTNHITIQNSRITNMGLFGIVVWRDNSHKHIPKFGDRKNRDGRYKFRRWISGCWKI